MNLIGKQYEYVTYTTTLVNFSPCHHSEYGRPNLPVTPWLRWLNINETCTGTNVVRFQSKYNNFHSRECFCRVTAKIVAIFLVGLIVSRSGRTSPHMNYSRSMFNIQHSYTWSHMGELRVFSWVTWRKVTTRYRERIVFNSVIQVAVSGNYNTTNQDGDIACNFYVYYVSRPGKPQFKSHCLNGMNHVLKYYRQRS